MQTEEQPEEIQMQSALPVSRIDKAIRKNFVGKRVSSSTSVYTTAALDAVFFEIVRASEEKRAGIRKGPKSIDRRTLVAAVRSSPELGRLFRSYVFAPEKAIKIKRDVLLTKNDKEAAKKKREEVASERRKKAAVPGIDEE